MWQGSGMSLITCADFHCSQTVLHYYLVPCFPLVLVQCPKVFAYQYEFDTFLSWLRCDSLCLCVCHSGGRTITVTGQGFDLVQSAIMQVQGIGQTVSNQLNCFSFNHIMKPVGMYNQVEQNRKYMLSMGHEVITRTTTYKRSTTSLIFWELRLFAFLQRVR